MTPAPDPRDHAALQDIAVRFQSGDIEGADAAAAAFLAQPLPSERQLPGLIWRATCANRRGDFAAAREKLAAYLPAAVRKEAAFRIPRDAPKPAPLALRNATHFVGKKAVDDYLASLSAQDMKSALAAAGKAGVRCTTLVKVGSVAAVIADTAQKDKFDMIVMGSKGRSAFKDLLIGSVAQRVSALATVPVLLVK